MRRSVGQTGMNLGWCADDEAEGLADADGYLSEAAETEAAASEEENAETKDEL